MCRVLQFYNISYNLNFSLLSITLMRNFVVSFWGWGLCFRAETLCFDVCGRVGLVLVLWSSTECTCLLPHCLRLKTILLMNAFSVLPSAAVFCVTSRHITSRVHTHTP